MVKSAAEAKRKATRTLFLKMGLALTSILVCLIAMEIGLRLRNRRLFSTANLVAQQLDLFQSAYPSQYDPEFGWVPKPGPSRDNIWGTVVTIMNDGLRSNGTVSPVTADSRPTVLAVGDSFTFGDEVSDNETWPAYLEAEMGTQVWNAGVFGYGLDQAVLRAEALIPKLKPDIVIVGLFADDIRRCALHSFLGVEKPYFDTVDGRLVSKNYPVPHSRRSVRDLDMPRRVFGHSFLVNSVMKRLAPEYWLTGTDFLSQSRAHHLEKEVACLLFERLRRLSGEKRIQVVVVGIYPKQVVHDRGAVMEQVLEYARGEGMVVLDLLTPLKQVKDKDLDRYERMYTSAHMAASGNRFVAQQIVALLRTRPELSSVSPAFQPRIITEQ